MEIPKCPYILLLTILLGGRETLQKLTQSTPESKLNLLPNDCGPSIDNKQDIGNVSYPWVAVILQVRDGAIIDRCAGSLINKRYVLTAAHSLMNLPLLSVILGGHTKVEDFIIRRDSKGVEIERVYAGPIDEFGIESFEVHQDYNRPKYGNDIGLIRLDRDVTMKYYIRPICLPVTDELRTQAFDSYVVTSWSRFTIAQSGFDALLEADVRSINNLECQQSLTEHRSAIQLSDKQLCTNGSDVICRGSGGAPLGQNANYNGVRFVQFGIVSFGPRICLRNSMPEVFTRVASYMDWILDTIRF